MKKKDYMPRKDEEFDVLQENVYNAAVANMSKWLIPQQVINALDAPRQRWKVAYAAFCNPATRTPAVIQEKKDARRDYQALLRTFIQGQIMHNSQVSDAERRAIGLPVYDRTPTKAAPPKTRPETEVDFSQIKKHTLHVRDSELKSAGKPAHVIGFEIWRRVGGDTEPAYEDMQLVELATRSPHTLEYASTDRGKTVWYAVRWVNTRGEKGPWSEIVMAIIP
jgi:hypothetical protein